MYLTPAHPPTGLTVEIDSPAFGLVSLQQGSTRLVKRQQVGRICLRRDNYRAQDS